MEQEWTRGGGRGEGGDRAGAPSYVHPVGRPSCSEHLTLGHHPQEGSLHSKVRVSNASPRSAGQQGFFSGDMGTQAQHGGKRELVTSLPAGHERGICLRRSECLSDTLTWRFLARAVLGTLGSYQASETNPRPAHSYNRPCLGHSRPCSGHTHNRPHLEHDRRSLGHNNWPRPGH